VVLDDAADEAQVRPLLPAGHRCAVVITSWSPLPTLGRTSRAVLDALPDDDACELLTRVAGREMGFGSAVAARTVVRLCGNLPLAVRAAGAWLAVRPHWSVARLAADLAPEGTRLDRLRCGDLDVRASLLGSYTRLSERQRLTFRSASVVSRRWFSATEVAAALIRPLDEVRHDLDALADAHLLVVAGDRAVRYRFPALAGILARELRGGGVARASTGTGEPAAAFARQVSRAG
jgi:hypothetical protein